MSKSKLDLTPPLWIFAAVLLLFMFMPVNAQEASAPAAPERAFVLAGKELVSLDVTSGNIIARVPVADNPRTVLNTADGSRLLVLSRGAGNLENHGLTFHPTGQSALTIVDAATLKALASVSLGWESDTMDNFLVGSSGRFLSADGRTLSVLCVGDSSTKAAEARPSELVTVDLTAAQVSSRLALDLPSSFLRTRSNESVAVAFYHRKDASKSVAASPSALKFIDPVKGQFLTTLELDGAPQNATFSPDGKFLYLLDSGHAATAPDKNVNGKLLVVDLTNQKLVTTLDAGSNPGLVSDSNYTFVLSSGTPTGARGLLAGVLRVMQGANLVASAPVAPSPLFMRLAPDHARLYVVGVGSITVMSYPDLTVMGEIPLEPPGASAAAMMTWIADVDHRADAMAISPDGTRGFVLFGGSSRLAVLDLEARRLVASVTTGRSGIKIGKFIGAFLAPVPLMPTGIAAANTAVLLSRDGERAYVLNTQSNDVTVVKATGEVVAKIGGGGNRLEFLSGHRFLAVVGASSIGVIDTDTNTKVSDVSLGGAFYLVPSPDGRYLVAVVLNKAIVTLDASTGQVLRRINLDSVQSMIFDAVRSGR